MRYSDEINYTIVEKENTMYETVSKKQVIYLKAEMILQYLEGGNDKLDTLVLCKPEVKLVTSDQSLYEALGAVKDKSKMEYQKLIKLLENVEIMSYEKTFGFPRHIMSFERVTELQKSISKSITGGQHE